MLLILAPSKTQKQEPLPAGSPQPTTPQFLEKSTKLINQLKSLSPAELAQLMKTSDKLTAATYRLIHNFTTPFHQQNAHPALYTFHGDAYDMVDNSSYSPTQLSYAQNHLIILSGLYGILRPLDLMQPYRLEMGLKFSPLQQKNLYQFWQQEITARVIKQLAAAKEKTIINLASNEYTKVLDKKALAANGCNLITITFQQPHAKGAEGYKTIPIHSKRARGLMTDYAIKKTLTEPEQLLVFAGNGYQFSVENSSADNWVFRQKQP